MIRMIVNKDKPMRTFDEAYEDFIKNFDVKPQSLAEAEWFYTRGKLDVQEERLKELKLK